MFSFARDPDTFLCEKRKRKKRKKKKMEKKLGSERARQTRARKSKSGRMDRRRFLVLRRPKDGYLQ